MADTNKKPSNSATAAATFSTSPAVGVGAVGIGAVGAPVRVGPFVADEDPIGPHPAGAIGPLPTPLRSHEVTAPTTTAPQVAGDGLTDAERPIASGLSEGMAKFLAAINEHTDGMLKLAEANEELTEELARQSPRKSKVREAAVTMQEVIKASDALFTLINKIAPSLIALVAAVALWLK